MKSLLIAATLIGLLSSQVSAQESESITSDCAGGGQKAISYDWNIFNGAISYNVALTNCKLSATGSSLYNGTISGSGTLLANSNGFNAYITAQEELTIAGPGQDSGGISCTTGIQGDYANTSQTFAGTITKNNCTYTIGATEINLVELLSQISFK